MASSHSLDYKSFPKIDLHRHLEGSLRMETLREIARQYALPLPDSYDLARLVQIQANDPQTMENFLAKFQVLRQFYQSPEIIQRVAYEAVADAALDGLCYVEIMFNPAAHNRMRGYPLDEVMDWVVESAMQASRDYGLGCRLIATINRHESPDLGARVAELAASRQDKGLTAINLAGNEAQYPAAPFKQIFNEAHARGLAVSIHAGEWNGAANVREAILDLHARRISHGVRVLEDPAVVALAREHHSLFEVCLTSNLQSGVTPSIQHHPLRDMLAAGLNVSLNTDDPAIEGITLSDEYRLAHEILQLPLTTLAGMTLAAARAAFLPDAEKEALLETLTRRLAPYQTQ
jgi:adenosine deaminase